jgi:hypothetical protein
MNFGLSPMVARFGHPAGVDPERFHLLGPYENDPARWLGMTWYDKYSGQAYRIGVGRETPGNIVQVKSYRDVILEYRVHPEPKSLDAKGKPCNQASVGLLSRRPVQLGSLVYIGKESNAVEQVEQELVHSRKEVQATYQPPHLAAWDLIYLPAIRRIPLKRLLAVTGLGSRAIRYIWRGQRRPSPAVQVILQGEAIQWAKESLANEDLSPEDREVAQRVLAASPGHRSEKRWQPVTRRRRGRRARYTPLDLSPGFSPESSTDFPRVFLWAFPGFLSGFSPGFRRPESPR